MIVCLLEANLTLASTSLLHLLIFDWGKRQKLVHWLLFLCWKNWYHLDLQPKCVHPQITNTLKLIHGCFCDYQSSRSLRRNHGVNERQTWTSGIVSWTVNTKIPDYAQFSRNALKPVQTCGRPWYALWTYSQRLLNPTCAGSGRVLKWARFFVCFCLGGAHFAGWRLRITVLIGHCFVPRIMADSQSSLFSLE